MRSCAGNFLKVVGSFYAAKSLKNENLNLKSAIKEISSPPFTKNRSSDLEALVSTDKHQY
ncbi:hypothetical protein SAMN02745166_00820 [Prosthecobacter debontii]|uniref:Uncharacterized protein n=1 Tax=Prosthecobacter debontii TaxID=48467 RepID=A0A1T4WY92_9BACT|nr:hypothetical protein SAMN02745166_00820 [Prosthecobacter debontii]